jgi:hypothetical protein
MWTLPRACAWACAWVCSLRRRGGRAHVDFAEGLRVGMRVGMFLETQRWACTCGLCRGLARGHARGYVP